MKLMLKRVFVFSSIGTSFLYFNDAQRIRFENVFSRMGFDLIRSTSNLSGSNKLVSSPSAQSGIVLVVSLIMLMLLTLIGVSAMQTTGLQEKMTGNMRDQNLAFQAAESALSAAENTLVPVAPAVMPVFTANGYNGFYSTATTINLTDSALLQDSFWTTNLVATSSVSNLGNKVPAPKYIIQELPATCYKASCPAPSDLSKPYRVTVRATGATANSVVILQSVFTP